MTFQSRDKPKYAIINADDYGFSDGVSEGIRRAHRQGIVTSTTVMANMPAAERAMARLADVPALGVGVHLNICQGPVLSEAGRALAGPEGVMERSAAGVLLACMLRPGLLAAVEAEFEAQIRWVLDHGLRPTHLDSHRHVHAYRPIFVRVLDLARRYDIPFLRRLREKLVGTGWPAASRRGRLTRRLVHAFSAGCDRRGAERLATVGTWGVAHTGRVDAAFLTRAARAAGPGVTEIMTHPGLGGEATGPATRLGDARIAELSALCDADVAAAFRDHHIQRIHYGQITR